MTKISKSKRFEPLNLNIVSDFDIIISNLLRMHLKIVIQNACQVMHCPKRAAVSVVFVSDKKMRELNRVYRGKDKTTNVLAFSVDPHPASGHPLPRGEGRVTPPFAKGGVRDLGDIFICLAEAKREAKKYGWTVKYSVARLTLHGFLHLLGYDHVKEKEARKMERIEKKVLEKFT